MIVKINGKESEIADNSSIQDLIAARKLPADTVIVELNTEIVRREQWKSLKLNPNDSLEIIQLAGGG